MRRWLPIALTTAILGWPAGARAQFGPGSAPGMRPMGQPPAGTPGDEKKEGPAEAAPEQAGQEPALQPLPAWPGQKDVQLQFLQLNGYMRGRAFLFHNFHLGIPESSTGVRPPFWVPYSEFGATGQAADPGNPASCAARDRKNCKADNLTSADIRMRLEPTVNVGDKVRLKAQFDVFDNYVMGSTPEGYYLNGLGSTADAPLLAFARAASSPEGGRNSFEDAIRVKRAWAEVDTPVGRLSFGRMPSHWGMGMLVNNGNCLDCDYGANVDRIMALVGGEKLRNFFVAALFDWVATGPNTRLYTPNQSAGPVYNADPLDDVWQVGLAAGRQNKPEDIKEKVDKGELVMNYGGYFVFRRQDWDATVNPGQNRFSDGGALGGQTAADLTKSLAQRGAWALISDLWFRLNWRKLYIEAEGAVIGGRINSVAELSAANNKPLDILQWGGVVRGSYKFLHDALHIGFEVGTASGDQSEDPNGVVNFRLAKRVRPANQTRISNFIFDPDYHVDLILYRRILGAVTGATYFKASGAYDIIDSLTVRADVLYSIANVPVSWPGNSVNIGAEIDASLLYHNDAEGFYAGIAYGVFFPTGALSIPAEIYGVKFDAEIPQTFQGRVVVKF